MLWERKIQLEKEMQDVLDPNVGQDVVGEMKKEIHRMQLRHGELTRLQVGRGRGEGGELTRLQVGRGRGEGRELTLLLVCRGRSGGGGPHTAPGGGGDGERGVHTTAGGQGLWGGHSGWSRGGSRGKRRRLSKSSGGRGMARMWQGREG